MGKHVKQTLVIGLVGILGALSASAIDLDRSAPNEPDRANESAASLPAPPPAEGKGDQDSMNLPRIQGIKVVKSRGEIIPSGNVSVTGVEIGPGEELDLLRGPDFTYLMEAFIGLPVSIVNIKAVQREITLYYRGRGRAVVEVVLPEQTSVGQGVVQVFVMEGRLGKVVVEGNHWSKPDDLLREMHIAEGAPIETDRLIVDVNWLNTNPGRTIDPALRPGAALGETDLVLRVTEGKIPWRFFLGVENSGPRFTSETRLLAGFNWFDAFGVGHILNYQFTTDITIDDLYAHSASYQIPLPWRHTLTFYGGYADAESDFPAPNPVVQKGTSWQASVRYNVPLPEIGRYRHQIAGGFDFKRFDNNLEFGGMNVFNTAVDIAQFALQYSGAAPDKFGSTSFDVSGYYSPGDLLGGNNDDASFALARRDSTANYIYGRASLKRETHLPVGMSWVLRVSGQLAEGNLQASEQMGLGGYATVRGFHEREVNGDSGYFISNEIYSPSFRVAKWIDESSRDSLRFLAFFDYGNVFIHDPLSTGPPPSPAEPDHYDLSSVGMGLRYKFSDNFNLRFDYGWQLRDSGIFPNSQTENSRGHVSAVVSF